MKIAQRVGWLKTTDEEGLEVVGDEVVAHCQTILEVFAAVDDCHVLQEVLDLL